MVVIIGVLIFTMLRFGKNDYQGLALAMAGRQRKAFQVLKPCPLCSAMLRKGETVKTKVIELVYSRNAAQAGRFSQNRLGVKETIAHVFGCPYCWPSNPDYSRVCPVCKTTLWKDDYVIARYFEKNEGRNHLHVLGCTRCRKK